MDKSKLPKAGGLEVKISPATVERLRKRVLELGKIDEKDLQAKPAIPFARIGAKLRKEFPELSEVTIRDYCCVVGKVPQEVFDLYISDQISFSELSEFGQSRIPKGDLLFIVREYVAQKMNLPQLRRLKSFLRTYGHKMSLREAIDRATGKISSFARPGAVKKINKDFDSLLDEAIRHMTLARAKVAQLLDLLPVSTMNRGRVHSELFNKVYLLRHILGEQYEFVDKKVKTYLDELVRFVSTESQVNELRKRENNGEPERDGQGAPLHGAG